MLYQAAREFEAQDAEVLAFRLDRRGAFGSTIELGIQLGLSTSPVAALRMAADGRDAFLIIDQLDAVSLSFRAPLGALRRHCRSHSRSDGG